NHRGRVALLVFRPELEGQAGQFRRGGAFELDLGVAPSSSSLLDRRILAGEIQSPDKRGVAVDDQDFPVVPAPAPDSMEEGTKGMERLDPDPLRAHPSEEVARRRPGTQGVIE